MFHHSDFQSLEDQQEQRARNLFWAAYIVGVLSGIGLAISLFWK